MPRQKDKLEVYLAQVREYRRLLEATNHHGGHTRRIAQLSARVKTAEQKLKNY